MPLGPLGALIGNGREFVHGWCLAQYVVDIEHVMVVRGPRYISVIRNPPFDIATTGGKLRF